MSCGKTDVNTHTPLQSIPPHPSTHTHNTHTLHLTHLHKARQRQLKAAVTHPGLDPGEVHARSLCLHFGLLGGGLTVCVCCVCAHPRPPASLPPTAATHTHSLSLSNTHQTHRYTYATYIRLELRGDAQVGAPREIDHVLPTRACVCVYEIV